MTKRDGRLMATHSSGDNTDQVNSRQDRLAADPALEPELAPKGRGKGPKGS